MPLQENKELFEFLIRETANYHKLPEPFIEKDYYIYQILKHLHSNYPTIVFKGGTSLSKCYKLIKRFSEDIDLSYWQEDLISQSDKRLLSRQVETTLNELDLLLLNKQDVKSRRNFNVYNIEIPASSTSSLKENLIIETYLALKAYPYTEKELDSYIGEYLQVNNDRLIQKFDLYPFKIKVQSLERTLVDKLYAVCDYYQQGKYDRNSRHLYDIYKIWQSRELQKDQIITLLDLVKIERNSLGKSELYPSAEEEYNLLDNLNEILMNDFFKEDYEKITLSLLYKEENVEYKKMKQALVQMVAELKGMMVY